MAAGRQADIRKLLTQPLATLRIICCLNFCAASVIFGSWGLMLNILLFRFESKWRGKSANGDMDGRTPRWVKGKFYRGDRRLAFPQLSQHEFRRFCMTPASLALALRYFCFFASSLTTMPIDLTVQWSWLNWLLRLSSSFARSFTAWWSITRPEQNQREVDISNVYSWLRESSKCVDFQQVFTSTFVLTRFSVKRNV